MTNARPGAPPSTGTTRHATRGSATSCTTAHVQDEVAFEVDFEVDFSSNVARHSRALASRAFATHAIARFSPTHATWLDTSSRCRAHVPSIASAWMHTSAPTSSSSSASASAVSSHSAPRVARANANRPSARSAKTPSPRATVSRVVRAHASSIAGAGNRISAAHIGGGSFARLIGVTRADAPSITATVPAEDTAASHENACSSTKPAEVYTRRTCSTPPRARATCPPGSSQETRVRAPSREGYRVSRFKYQRPFPRRQI